MSLKMIVKPARVEFLDGPVPAGSHHSVFRRRSCVDPKGCALVSHELDLNQIDSTIGSSAPHFPKRKDVRTFSVDRAAGFSPRSYGKSSPHQRRKQMCPNALYQQIFTSFCFSFSCSSSSEPFLEGHAQSLSTGVQNGNHNRRRKLPNSVVEFLGVIFVPVGNFDDDVGGAVGDGLATQAGLRRDAGGFVEFVEFGVGGLVAGFGAFPDDDVAGGAGAEAAAGLGSSGVEALG